MNHPFTYIGCFFDFDDFQSAVSGVRSDPLENDIQAPHVTFKYMPKKVDLSLFGETVKVRILGYGNNGRNEGVKVELESDNPILGDMIAQIEIPHITIAVSRGGKPVDTKYLDFEDIPPIELTGQYGGYDKDFGVIIGYVQD